MGMRLLLVCGLSLLMMIPALFVEGLLSERSARSAQVKEELIGLAGGEQMLLGPTLAVPFCTPYQSAADPGTRGIYLVFPTRGSAEISTSSSQRRRSLFRVAVYEADAEFTAHFDLSEVPKGMPAGTQMQWDRAQVVVGLSNLRGVLAEPVLHTAAGDQLLQPAESFGSLAFLRNGALTVAPSDNAERLMPLLGASLTSGVGPGAVLDLRATLRFSGGERLTVLPFAQTSDIAVRGTWRTPGFEGASLPVERTLSRQGFTARWFLPLVAREVQGQGPLEKIAGLEAAGVSVRWVEGADAYQPVERSLKYAPLFVTVVFLSYFLLEVTSGKRVHPAQYVLVGMVQVIFYLLLLSFAEHAGFGGAYALAASATVLLLAAYVQWIFASRREAVRALSGFSLLYLVIYLLLQMEDNALLVGSVASFAALAALMWWTRSLDWYATFTPENKPQISGEALRS